ncbi:MFS transporter [Fimbriiglobus ruber]|uniref:4-hydroxybenzoate transporter n=1 Tax=Fimbriiglobus ruber TaxID=1908690 RepID=A0A225DK95_9BACT|nr:MFS transporter [Fimbriiglobus ruber]OWK36805.1 4-hydroxybenzoate transporter [Fimbriiglobus ruber]
MSSTAPGSSPGLSPVVRFLVLAVASIGFLFDTYELLMLPVIAGPALSELLQVPANNPLVRQWVGWMLWSAAVCGGLFGLLGGFLIDRFGRKTVMVGSILLYSLSPLAAAFSSEAWMLLVFRCTTFIGICVEFVAAITWLAELFEDRRTRELAIGWTQAFASVGGLLVTGANALTAKYAADLPALPVEAPLNAHAGWRYTLISGLIPGALILMLMPFVPESQAWLARKRAGTLRRPRFGELFAPGLVRTTLVATALSACAYAGAFGALQLTPAQVVPGLPELAEHQKALQPLAKEAAALNGKLNQTPRESDERKDLIKQIVANRKQQEPHAKPITEKGTEAQFWQEIGGLAGRIVLAVLVVVIASRRTLLRVFLLPGLVMFPLTYYYLFQQQPDVFVYGVFLCGLCTVAQFSYFGEYLPKAFPLHLRGTGGSFATNVGGRMIGTSASLLTTAVVAPLLPGSTFVQVATGAAIVGGGVYVIGLLLSFVLPEPKEETLVKAE